jgi:hypothetical protein
MDPGSFLGPFMKCLLDKKNDSLVQRALKKFQSAREYFEICWPRFQALASHLDATMIPCENISWYFSYHVEDRGEDGIQSALNFKHVLLGEDIQVNVPSHAFEMEWRYRIKEKQTDEEQQSEHVDNDQKWINVDDFTRRGSSMKSAREIATLLANPARLIEHSTLQHCGYWIRVGRWR